MGDLCNLKSVCLCLFPEKLEMVVCAQILPRHKAEAFGSYFVRWHLRQQSELYFKRTHTFSQFISNVCFSSFSLCSAALMDMGPGTVSTAPSMDHSSELQCHHVRLLVSSGFELCSWGGLFEFVCLFLDLETYFKPLCRFPLSFS